MMNMTEGQPTSAFMRSLSGETLTRPPIWLMRQAGRYLPEYRAIREEAGGFLELCYRPDFAAEVTLQPIRRFGFDAAILFADILLIPQALGQKLWFATGEGPRLDPIVNVSGLRSAEDVHETLNPVYETVKLVKESLPNDTPLIGFAGAPWTVATYMIAGRGTPDQAPAHALMKNDPNAFQGIIDIIINATIVYLSAQITAGADVIKLFDSWAGSLEGEAFEKFSVDPCRRIAEGLRQIHPDIPIIGFPRGAGDRAESFVDSTKVTAIAIGQDADLEWARDHLQPKATVQGNLDPKLLVEGGERMKLATEEIIQTMANGPHIFNLGHGVTPDVNPRHVEDLVRIVKG